MLGKETVLVIMALAGLYRAPFASTACGVALSNSARRFPLIWPPCNPIISCTSGRLNMWSLTNGIGVE
jgi:hypothetical protein